MTFLPDWRGCVDGNVELQFRIEIHLKSEAAGTTNLSFEGVTRVARPESKIDKEILKEYSQRLAEDRYGTAALNPVYSIVKDRVAEAQSRSHEQRMFRTLADEARSVAIAEWTDGVFESSEYYRRYIQWTRCRPNPSASRFLNAIGSERCESIKADASTLPTFSSLQIGYLQRICDTGLIPWLGRLRIELVDGGTEPLQKQLDDFPGTDSTDEFDSRVSRLIQDSSLFGD